MENITILSFCIFYICSNALFCLNKDLFDKVLKEPAPRFIRERIQNGILTSEKSQGAIYHTRLDMPLPHFEELGKLVSLPDADFILTGNDGANLNVPLFCVTQYNIQKAKTILISEMFAFQGFEPARTNIFQGNSLHSWELKINQVFYRGTDDRFVQIEDWLGHARPRLILFSAQYSDIVNMFGTSTKSIQYRKWN